MRTFPTWRVGECLLASALLLERELGLHGFVHQVAAGAEPRSAESTIASFQAESVVEALQAEIWGGRAADRLRAEVRDLEDRWHKARPGGQVEVQS